MKFIDFFAGIGSFRSGMELANHKCVGFIEIDKYAVKSYRAMYEAGGEYYANDIRAVKPGDLPKADCYCAGFPCQSFSVAGKRGGFEDARGTLIFEIFRLVKDRKPRLLFFENVEGLLNHSEGETFKTILCAMGELGYDAEWQCINSKNYVPQNRERVYIIGHLRGTCEREIFPVTGENEAALKQLIGGSQGNKIYDSNGISCSPTSQSGGFSGQTGLYFFNKQNDNISIRDNAACLDANYGKGLGCKQQRTGVLEIKPCLTPDRLEKRQNGRRFKEDGEPMFTLTAQDIHGIEIEGRIRRLTPLECFRLQGFSDEQFYKAQAVNSDYQLYKQAGNSVTVNVIYDIAKRLE